MIELKLNIEDALDHIKHDDPLMFEHDFWCRMSEFLLHPTDEARKSLKNLVEPFKELSKPVHELMASVPETSPKKLDSATIPFLDSLHT